jgi:cytochrome c oxidase subunit 2
VFFATSTERPLFPDKEYFVTNRSNFVVIAALAMFTLFAVVACSDGEASPFSTTTPVPTSDASAADNPGDSGATGPDVANGEKQFASLGCSGCHTTDASQLIGPGLAGISSKGDDYIRKSIVDPRAEIVDGFSNIMPTSFSSLKESDLADLVAYLKTLR